MSAGTQQVPLTLVAIGMILQNICCHSEHNDAILDLERFRDESNPIGLHFDNERGGILVYECQGFPVGPLRLGVGWMWGSRINKLGFGPERIRITLSVAATRAARIRSARTESVTEHSIEAET